MIDYEVPDPDEDEQFTYDILGNRITLNPRVGGNVVYASNTVNEYTDIGGVTPLYDACGSLTKDIGNYTYHYDNDNRLTKIKNLKRALVPMALSCVSHCFCAS